MAPAQAQKAPDGGGSSSGIDLALEVIGPDQTPPRGATFPVTIEVTNVGSETAPDVSLSTYLPETLTLGNHAAANPSTTCTQDQYGSLTCSLPSLAPGEMAWVTLTLERTMARETWIDVWTASSAQEVNWEDNYGGVYLPPDRSNPADVWVEISSAPEQPDPGASFSYTAVVTNRGPELARAVRFNQSIAEGAEFVSVTSSDPSDECSLFEETYDAEGIEGGPYTYREVRCNLGNMGFAEQTTITVDVVRADPHELWSSAWVQTASYDENYDNDWADASTAGHPSVTSDLGMTLTRPEGLPLVGQDFSYTMTFTNNGPAPATDVVADTWVPEQLALRAVTPSRDGDVCTQGEYQGISCTFGNLAVGETTTVVVDVTRVAAREFWMGGSVWSTNSDSVYENNYVEEQVGADTSVPADISVSADGPKDPAVGSNFDYTLVVTNNGPSPATAVSLKTSLPENTDFVSATSPDDSDVCTLFEESYDDEGRKMADGEFAPYTYREVRCDLGTLVPAESATVTVTLTRTDDYEMWASAWATTASYDDNYENDYASLGSMGKAIPSCGALSDSDGITACDTAGKVGGGDGASAERDYYYAGTEGGTRVLSSGKGNDTITVRVPSHSRKHRTITVNAGSGRDTINVLIASGAGNVTVILKGGAGRDSIDVVAPRTGKRFKLRMIGGRGNDTCSSAMGARHRSRAC
jgi:uncharacterized repeat protein (TIGR01451 family)